MGDHLRIEILQKLKMNGFVSIALLLALVAAAQAFFYDPATGVFSLLANSQTLANGLVLTSGTTTAYLTSAGIAVGGLGLLAIALAKIDNYFQQVSAMDVDDCGKLLVCTLETVSAEERTPEEQLISTLFGETATIDPASPKAEYDLAAYLGQATGSKTACARRYTQCPMDRKTISQALAKMARIQQ